MGDHGDNGQRTQRREDFREQGADLQTLYLKGSQITDAGLVNLKGLNNLKDLDLSGTNVTDAGIAELQKALPNCEIEK